MSASVAFVSLFLSLVSGTQPVEVAITGPVTAVHILVDGELVATARPPSWRADCELGPAILPHRLQAVALDAEGRELARAEQVVNLPRPRAEARLVVDGGDATTPRSVRLVTANALGQAPVAAHLSLDGVPMEAAAPLTWRLPPVSPAATELLSAEAHFPNGDVAAAVAAAGGAYGNELRADLTAVPVQLELRRGKLSVAAIDGALRVNGRPLKVVAVERRGMRVLMVQDCATSPRLRSIDSLSAVKWLTPKRREDLMPPDIDSEAARLRAVETIPAFQARQLDAFPVTDLIDLRRWSIPWVALHLLQDEAKASQQHLADAVAVAGIEAAATGRPRGVILILGNGVDHSEHTPEQVRSYLRALRVPLTVLSPERTRRPGAWGEAADVSSGHKLDAASRHLERELARQWIVWVEGSYLPHEIELETSNQALSLVGG